MRYETCRELRQAISLYIAGRFLRAVHDIIQATEDSLLSARHSPPSYFPPTRPKPPDLFPALEPDPEELNATCWRHDSKLPRKLTFRDRVTSTGADSMRTLMRSQDKLHACFWHARSHTVRWSACMWTDHARLQLAHETLCA